MAAVKGRRQQAAEDTRRAIVDAALAAFLADGYVATTVARVAADAGVAVQTVYNAVGGKAELLSRALDLAAAGDRAPVSVPVFMREWAAQAPDAEAVIDALVTFWEGALARTAPVFGVIRQAAALDPEVAALELRRSEARLRNYGEAATALRARGALRTGLTDDDAAALIHAIGHPDAYRFLVVDLGWTPARWSAWVRDGLRAALLTPAG
ncbi:MAG: TetR/AcrR family transcriptional regulator [Thermoleophilia bacterium]